jgi:hypothetical protein
MTDYVLKCEPGHFGLKGGVLGTSPPPEVKPAEAPPPPPPKDKP